MRFVLALLVLEGLLSTLPETSTLKSFHTLMDDALQGSVANVMILGDSVSFGLYEQIVQKTLAEQGVELKVENLSIPSTSAFFAYFELRRLVDAGRAPQTVVLAYNPRSYTIYQAGKFIGVFATRGELISSMTMRIPWQDCMAGLLARYSFTLRYREEINDSLRRADFEFFRQLNLPGNDQDMRDARYAKAEFAFPQVVSDEPFDKISPALLLPFVVPEAARRSLERFFDLAEAEGIQVFYVDMPECQSMHAARQENGFAHAHREWLAQQEMQGHFKILIDQPGVYPDALFRDAMHFLDPISGTFSRELGTRLAQALQNEK